jgi:hypothetical protein
MNIELLQMRTTRNHDDHTVIIDMLFLVEGKTITRTIAYDTKADLFLGDTRVAPWKVLMYEVNKNLLNIEKEVTFHKHSIDWADHLPKHEKDIHPSLPEVISHLEEMSKS